MTSTAVIRASISLNVFRTAMNGAYKALVSLRSQGW
jgi:hypothetical protein